jgi:membrane-associated protease RseP (regulator of RpoE activity)
MFDQSQMQPTPFDLRWQMFGIPVRVHPFFWLVILLLGPKSPGAAILWVFAAFISILVHEFGHALTAKAYGSSTEILLYSFGGLAFHHLPSAWVGPRIIVLLAGPGAGFLLAALIWIGASTMLGPPDHTFLEFLTGHWISFGDEQGTRLEIFIELMLRINIWWGILNLLPVNPLDGGQIARTYLTWIFPTKGDFWAGQLSIATAIGVVVFALVLQDWYLALLFGLLAFNEFQRLQAVRQRMQEPRWDRWD